MKPIIKQLAAIAAFLFLWYAALVAVSYALYPEGRVVGGIDTAESSATIFYSGDRCIMFGLPKLAQSPKDRIFLIGASNVRDGFRPKELQSLLPSYEVHNLGLGASNISQMQDIANLLFALPRPVLERSVIVIGVWYGSFVANGSQQDTVHASMLAEQEQYGLYKFDHGRAKLNVNSGLLPYMVAAMRPYFMCHIAASKVREFAVDAREWLHIFLRERRVPDFRPGARPKVDDRYKDEALKKWADYMGSADGKFKDEQFKKLIGLCRAIHESGASVVIVDMPLPRWHRDGSRNYAEYQKVKMAYIDEALKTGRARYLDLEETITDEDFCDSAHPKAAATKRWSELLGKAITDMSKQNYEVRYGK